MMIYLPTVQKPNFGFVLRTGKPQVTGWDWVRTPLDIRFILT